MQKHAYALSSNQCAADAQGSRGITDLRLTFIAGAVYGMQRDAPNESTAPYIEHVPDQVPAKEPKSIMM